MTAQALHRPVGWAAGASLLIAAHASAQFVFVPQPPVVFANNHFPTHLAAADLDGDLDLDLVVPGRDTDGLAYVLFGAGDGTFATPVPLTVGGQTDWIELGDIDGDGLLDLVFAYRSRPSGLAVMRGIGGGAFAKVELASFGREVRSVALRDFDGDGDLDVAGMDYTGFTVLVWSNDGAGAFAPIGSYRMNDEWFGLPNPNSLVAGDIDNDGDADLVVTAIGAGRVDVMLNNGDATFAPEIGYRPPQTAGVQPALSNSALGDMDQDGDLDIVTPWIMGYQFQRVGVLLNKTDQGQPASFDTPVNFNSLISGVSWWPALADLDGDGDLDVAVGYGLPGPIGLMMNVPFEGSFFLLQLQSFEIGQFVRSILPADVDGDGDVDLVLLEAPSNQVIVLRNDTPQQGGMADGVAGESADAASARRAAQRAARRTAELSAVAAARAKSEHPTPGARGEAPDARRPALADSNADAAIDAADLAADLAAKSFVPAAAKAATPPTTTPTTTPTGPTSAGGAR
jgi:hypothetical protein